MQRICFILKVRQERLDDYRRRHRAVWPEMLAALAETGWHNYSLFLSDDGLLVGYLLTENFVQARTAIQAFEVNARWQAEMAQYFEMSDLNPDQQMKPLEEVFHLD